MILPTKHLAPGESLLGVAALLLRELQTPRSVNELWENVREIPGLGTFDRYTLALDLLFIMGLATFRRGRLTLA